VTGVGKKVAAFAGKKLEPLTSHKYIIAIQEDNFLPSLRLEQSAGEVKHPANRLLDLPTRKKKGVRRIKSEDQMRDRQDWIYYNERTFKGKERKRGPTAGPAK